MVEPAGIEPVQMDLTLLPCTNKPAPLCSLWLVEPWRGLRPPPQPCQEYHNDNGVVKARDSKPVRKPFIKSLLIFAAGVLVGLAAPFLYFSPFSAGSSLKSASYHDNRRVIEDYAKLHDRYCTVTTSGSLLVRKWQSKYTVDALQSRLAGGHNRGYKSRNVKHPSECGARIELAN